jgi:hypothetical protein
LRAIDAESADAEELTGLSLVDFRHYTPEELADIIEPLPRRNKLKYRKLHAFKPETGCLANDSAFVASTCFCAFWCSF